MHLLPVMYCITSLSCMRMTVQALVTKNPVGRFALLRSRVQQQSITGKPSMMISSTARYVATGPMPVEEDKMPYYALGTNLALQVGGKGNLKAMLNDDEMELLLQGFCETIRGTSTHDPVVILEAYGYKLNKIIKERTDRITERVKKEGDSYISNFIDCNKGAFKSKSGLVYLNMIQGTGASPTIRSTVEVHYHGQLIDGTVFDSSVDRGQTISFPLMSVIKGWQEGLQLMKEGGKATLVVPSNLAYGEAGSGDTIPPGSTLKFEVELFKVS